jgi:hypothetical protein
VAREEGEPALSVTAEDYSWWRQWRPAWAEAHCVTLVSDATVEDVIDSLHAHEVTRAQGIDALYERVVEDWPGDYDPFAAKIGVADIGHGWVLVAEINGYAGVTEALVGPVSSGRTVVSHFGNVNAVHRFQWWRDGLLLVDFDPMFPMERYGSDPDALAEYIMGVGIRIDAEPEDIAGADLSAAGFALAERITGVACTPDMFERSDFLMATVTIPSD